VDVARALNARFLNEGDAANRRVLSTSLCARSAANALHAFRPGSLIVTSGDRDDIVLASALATMNGVPMAGVLLTNGFMPNDNMIEMCRPALKTGMPVLAWIPTASPRPRTWARWATTFPWTIWSAPSA
jgi:phosphate acetyltransferase